MGDCAWKSNLSRAAFLWVGEENRVGYLSEAGDLLQGPHACTLTLVPPFLTFFSSFLDGLQPRWEALGSVEKHHLNSGRSYLGGVWVGMGLCSLHPGQTLEKQGAL